jgi:hypothetical protein
MINHSITGLTRINRKIDLNATTVLYNSYKLMHHQLEHKAKFKIKDKKHWLNALGLALLRKNEMLVSSQLNACGTPILLLLDFQ